MEERAFLDTLAANPADEVTRLVYADWLDERDDPRGLFIRLEQQSLALPVGDERQTELASQLRHLAQTLDRAWLRTVSRSVIENCNPLALIFAFECPKRWDQLKPTNNPRVRRCTACRRSVFYCDTMVEARAKAQRGECIAIALPVIRVPGDAPPRRLLRMGKVRVGRVRGVTRQGARGNARAPEDDDGAPPPRKRKRR